MRYLYLVFCLGLICNFQFARAGNISLNNKKTSSIEIKDNTISKLVVQHSLSDIKTLEVNTPLGGFTKLIVPDYSATQEIGYPELPVLRRLIEIPSGADISVSVITSHYTEMSLQSLVLPDIIPAQPPQIKDDESDPVFRYDTLAYQQNSFYPVQLATVDVLGFMRGLRLGRLNILPVQYNPVTRTLRIYDDITIEIKFLHPDPQLTRINKKKNLNPFFNTLGQVVLNPIPADSPLDTIIQNPVKYVIVSNPMFASTLQPFIQWKKKKGFTVIEAYTNNPAVGNTSASIKNYLQGLYNAGNPGDPPPSFVLLVGDVAQLPTFAGTLGSHPTDLYYCEYTGDYLPDAYYGRFSAINTTQLQAEISKTLDYEQYTMPDPSFLNECVMIAGADPSFGPTHANGQVNYGTSTYFNTAHGLNSHTYLYPASASQDAQIIQDVSNGCCYANYTAHGSSSGWADPTFTVANIPSLSNQDKYPLMVGNACLTNKFDDPECFGEALIRATGKGALGYIGASDNTYWDEDFWWAVGAKPISSNPTYSPTALGAYDHTFHDHGEPYSQWFMTQGQMVYAGNLAVAQGSPESTNYYWEIYHLLGDPSLMVYYSEPSSLPVTFNSPLPLGLTNFSVTTEPYAYAAISQDGILHGATQADASGIANISIIPFTSPGIADVVVTAQNFQPYLGTVDVQTPNAPFCLFDGYSLNDSSGNNDGQADYGEYIQLSLGLVNVGLQDASNITATISSTDTNITINDSTGFFGNIPAGNTLILTDNYAFTVSNNVPDGHSVLFLVTISDGTNVWTGNFSVIAHAPVLVYQDNTVSDPGGNQNNKLDPGENDSLTITIHNTGSSDASSINWSLSTSSPYIAITNPEQFSGILHTGESTEQSFNLLVGNNAPAGTTAVFTLILTADSARTYTASFSLIIGQVPVLVLNLDGNNNSAIPLHEAIQANNINSVISNSFPSNLGDYTAIFICLGVYNNNHKLTNAEGTALASYLNNGGRIYMEGGDTWYFNTVTPVHPMFNITGLGDGTSDLDTLNGQAGTFTEGMYFRYSGDNNYIDRISPKTGTAAFSILKNSSPPYSTAVAYDGGIYKTIGASHEFAGLNDGDLPSTRNQLMMKYLEFFGLITYEVTADFTATPTTLTQGNTVSFTDASSGNPDTWSWFFPGGTPSASSLQNPVITYNTPGSYPVSLTASNGSGNNTLIRNAYITVNPGAAALSLGSYTGCASTFKVPVMANSISNAASISFILNYNATGMSYVGYDGVNSILNGSLFINQSGNAVNFVWFSLIPVSIASDTLINLIFQGLNTGTYLLTWNTTLPDNCQITNFDGVIIPSTFYNGQVEITATGSPANVFITVSPGTEVCSGSAVTFTAYGCNTGASPTYVWKRNGVDVASGLTYTTSILSNSDSISCQMTSGAACASGNPATSNKLGMIVYQPAVIDLGNDTTVPFGQTLTLTPGAGFSSYQWSTGSTEPDITVNSTGTYSVTVTASTGCISIDSIHVTVISFNSISGTLTYSNSVQTPLGNTLVQLKSGNTVITHALTAADGSFVLTPVNPGNYQFNVVCTKPWGGVNSTDALLAMKHFVGMSYLNGLYLKAADVDLSNTINALDALIIQRRVVGLLSYFPAGDWIFTKPTVNFTGLQPTSVSINGLCVGDVNGSHLPPALAQENVELVVKGEEIISADGTLDIPISIENSVNLGAISLFLTLPDNISINDITGLEEDNNLVWKVKDNLLALSWFAVTGKIYKPSDVLFTLKTRVNTKDLSEINQGIQLLNASEFSDNQAKTLQHIKLGIPRLVPEISGIDVQIAPNPFGNETAVQCSLVKAGHIEISILDITGRLIKDLCDQDLPAGFHSFNWNGDENTGSAAGNGVYLVRIITPDGILTKNIVKTR